MAEEGKKEEKAEEKEEEKKKELIGKITHYYNKIGVAVVELEGGLKQGDKILIESPDKSHTFEQTVESMQIEKEKIEEAKKGQAIGMKVNENAREGYKVYKLEE